MRIPSSHSAANRFLRVLVVLPLLLAACGGSGAVMQEIDGVLHVLNPAEPLRPDMQVTMTEQFRLGSEEDDYLFTGIGGFDVDDAGNIYLLIAREDEVRVFDPDGAYLRTFSRHGAGPGELSSASGLSFGADGNLWVSNLGNQRMTIFGTDGTHVRDIPFGGIPPMLVETTRDGFMGLYMRYLPGDQEGVVNLTFYLRKFDTEGDSVDTLFESNFTMDITNLQAEGIQSQTPLYTQDDLGRVWQARPRVDAYEINVFRPTGGIERVVSKEYQPIYKTDEEMEEEKRLVMDAIRAQTGGEIPPEFNYEPARGRPATGLLFFDPQGYVWVGVSEEGELASGKYDVFDMEGQWLTTVKVPGMNYPAAAVFSDGKAYFAEGDPGEIPRLVIFTVDYID